jgi:DNA phosphorothioation-associated putative methyltransferase
MSQIEQSGVRREKTAIVRFRHSKPMMLALLHGIISSGTSVFDYGCGHGEDLRYLEHSGIEANGWDPHYRPSSPRISADVVNLGYVLNVIEDPRERRETLQAAYELARRVLVVAVRVDRTLESAVEFSDGFLTTRGSFQKLYCQSEFKDYLQETLGRRPHMAALGIAYVFKDAQFESSYLASLSQRRVDSSRTHAIEQFTDDPTAKKYMALANTLGRPALATEFEDYDELQDRFGSTERIERLTRQLLSQNAIRDVRHKKRDDILTFIAMTRLQGLKPVPFHSLSREIRADIKMFWASYSGAIEEGERFLFQIGNPDAVRAACQTAPIGKKLPDALYIHHSCEEQLGAVLRLVVLAARQIVGDVDYNVVKIKTDGRSVSFLKYDQFEEDPHPALHHSVRIYLPRAEYVIRDYSRSANPPILHRKETMVDPLHQSYTAFAELTRQEEQLGLLSRIDIGTRQGWLAVLAETGFTIEGYRIQAANGSTSQCKPDSTL